MEYGQEPEMEGMDPAQSAAKVSALKDLISMMQDLIVKEGGEAEPMMQEGAEEMSEGADMMSGAMGESEKDLGLGDMEAGDDSYKSSLKDYMKGKKEKAPAAAMQVAVSVSKNKAPPFAGKGKNKKSKMKRYG